MPAYRHNGVAKWACLPERAGFARRDETTWKGLVMGSFAVMTAFYLTAIASGWPGLLATASR